MSHGQIRSALLSVAISVLVVATSTGCRPGVAWLPDGSGLLYTEKGGSRLVTYSVAKKARRVVVADTGTNTILPAVSPDSKYFAVGRAVTNPNRPTSVQILVFNIDGSRAKNTSVHTVGKSDSQAKAATLLGVALAWGKQNTLVGCVNGAQLTFIVDLERDRITELPGLGPFPVDAWSPVRPDRKGFLAVTGTEEDGNFAFIDWDGWEQRLGKAMKFDESGPVEWKWDGNTARIARTDSVFLVDTDARTVQKRNERLEYMPSIGRLLQCHSFDGAGTKLCGFIVDEKSGGQATTYNLVEFQNPRAGRRRAIVPRCDAADFFSSPDRKLVAVRTSDQIVVVDSSGNVVGQTVVEK